MENTLKSITSDALIAFEVLKGKHWEKINNLKLSDIYRNECIFHLSDNIYIAYNWNREGTLYKCIYNLLIT